MDAKICNQCGFRIDDGGEYFVVNVTQMEGVGKVYETEPDRELCVGCMCKLRPALDIIDGK